VAFNDILVHIGNSDHCGAVLDLAIGLARQHQAHLTGLYVITHRHYSSQLESAHGRAAEAEAVFRAKTAEAGLSAHWLCVDWPVVGEKASKVVNLHAFCKDMVVVGQTEIPSRHSEVEPDLPETVILGSGCPVLVVPYAGAFQAVGERVMVAWKTGRESARAVKDAMPFLRTAREARILALGPASAGEGADRVVDHLARHGIAAERELFSVEEIPVGDVLLNQAWEERCDLLVLGGYTRTSRGTVLGPTARHILKHMTVPVLMSH